MTTHAQNDQPAPGTGRSAGSTKSGTASGGPKPIHSLTCSNCGTPNRIGSSERGVPHCGKCGQPLAWVVDADESTFELETRAQPTVVVDLWRRGAGRAGSSRRSSTTSLMSTPDASRWSRSTSTTTKGSPAGSMR